MRRELSARDGTLAKVRRERGQIQLTVEQQQEHLDLLTAQLQFQLDRSAEVRNQLMNAHEQLARRDEVFLDLGHQETALIALVLRTRAWRHRLKARLGLVRS